MHQKNKSVIVDSSALVALLYQRDADHLKAVKLEQEMIACGLLTLLPHEVLAETVNLLGKKFGRRVAADAARALLSRRSTGDIDFISPSDHTLYTASELQLSGKGNPSFVDCLVMAHAKEKNTRLVFGFDATFKKNNFRLP